MLLWVCNTAKPVCGALTCECSPLFLLDPVCVVDPVVSVGKVTQQDEQLGFTGRSGGTGSHSCCTSDQGLHGNIGRRAEREGGWGGWAQNSK